MAQNKTLMVTFIANTKSMTKSMGNMEKHLRGFNKQIEMQSAGMRVSNKGAITDMQTGSKILKEDAAMRMGTHRTFMRHNQEKKKALKSMRNIQLGAHLSMMFMGMQLARTFNNVLRSIKNTYDKATAGNTELGKGTTRITASWEFLKFSIFNALNQPGMISFIDFLVNGVKWLGEWISEHKALGVAIMATFGVLALGGTILMMVGQFSLFWFAVFGPAGLIAASAAKGMGTAAAASGTVTGAFATMMAVISGIIAGGIIIYVLLDIFGDGDKPVTARKLFTNLGLAGIAGFMLGGLPGAFAVASIVFLISFAMAGGFGKKIEEFKKKSKTQQAMSLLSPGFGLFPGSLGMDFFESFGKGLSEFLTGSERVKEVTENMTDQTNLMNESIDKYSNETVPGAVGKNSEFVESYGELEESIFGNRTELESFNTELNEMDGKEVNVTIVTHHVDKYSESGRSSNY